MTENGVRATFPRGITEDVDRVSRSTGKYLEALVVSYSFPTFTVTIWD
jgi:hypothetical protein